MTVAYFANQFADQKGHGLARYSRELFHALQKIGQDIVPVAGWSSLEPEHLAQYQAETGLQLTGLGRRGTSLLWTFLNRPTIESRLTAPVDVVHAVSLGYPIATRKPYVVTIHDLGPITHPEYFRAARPWVMERSLNQAVAKADVIVCVSETTAAEVLEVAGTSVESRLRVVKEGVDERFFTPPDLSGLKDLEGMPKDVPFILSAGQISPRKNIGGLMKAMTHVLDEIPHHLVLVGGKGWDTQTFEAEISSLGLSSRVHVLGFVDDEVLRALYHTATLYVHPSLYEGFGLPVLEAMASGTPVIASDRSSLPEVAGGAARLSDTTDAVKFASDIVDVCNTKELRAKMTNAGLIHARTFSWSESASAMAEIYKELGA